MIRLSHPSYLLQVHEFTDALLREDVMAPADARQMKSERAGKSAGFLKTKAGGSCQRFLEHFANLHEIPPA